VADTLTRILHLIPALDEGGAERVVVNTAIMEQAHGLQPIVVSSGGKMVRELEAAGIEHLLLPMASKFPLNILHNGRHLARLIRERNVHLVHVHSRAPSWSGLLASRSTNIPMVATFHGVYRHQNVFKRFYNSSMTRADAILAPSQFIKDHVTQVYNVPANQITLVHPWIHNFNPVSMLDLDEFRRQNRLKEGQAVFCVVGRLSRLKGHEIVLRAFAMLDDFDAILLVAGSEQHKGYMAELGALASELGIIDRVIFTGGNRNIPQLAYGVSRALISASTHPESFGLTVLEAANCGVPALVTAHGGVLDLVTDARNGFLVPPGDPVKLAEAMGKLLRLSDSEYATMSQEARCHAARFKPDAIVPHLLKVYRQLLAGGSL
jgi:glycosyltransferase involved in cell wall biosynthesis